MITTDVKQKEMQTWCQQTTKSLKRSPPQLLLLYLASKNLAEWQKKVSLLCLNTVAGYSEEAPSILGVYYHSYVYHYLLALVELISRWIQNFRRTEGLYLPCFSWLKHWTKRFCADFSRSVANRMQVITNKTHHNTLINGMSLFFPWEFNRLCFSKASGRDSKQNRIFLQRNWRIFTPQSRCLLNAVLTQMIRFWIPPMMLSDRSAHTTWPLSVKQAA